MSRSNLQDIEVLFCHQTERAVGFWKDEDHMKSSDPIWIPLSICEVSGTPRRGGVVTVTAEQNVLEERGLV